MNRLRDHLLILLFFSPQIDCLYINILADIPNLIKSIEKHLGYSPVYLFDSDIHEGMYAGSVLRGMYCVQRDTGRRFINSILSQFSD